MNRSAEIDAARRLRDTLLAMGAAPEDAAVAKIAEHLDALNAEHLEHLESEAVTAASQAMDDAVAALEASDALTAAQKTELAQLVGDRRAQLPNNIPGFPRTRKG